MLNNIEPPVTYLDAVRATVSTFKVMESLKTHLPEDVKGYVIR